MAGTIKKTKIPNFLAMLICYLSLFVLFFMMAIHLTHYFFPKNCIGFSNSIWFSKEKNFKIDFFFQTVFIRFF